MNVKLTLSLNKDINDSNIILDVLAKRKPFYDEAAQLFTLLDRGELQGFTSPIIFAILHSLLSKKSFQKDCDTEPEKIAVCTAEEYLNIWGIPK